MDNLEKLTSQTNHLEKVATSYIDKNREEYFKHPPILLQMIDMNQCLVTDSRFSMECMLPQRQKSWERCLIQLNDWCFKINFNSNTHYLSFDMQAKEIHTLGELPYTSQRCPKLTGNNQFRNKLDTLRKSFMKVKKLIQKLFRMKLVEQDFTGYKGKCEFSGNFITFSDQDQTRLYVPYEKKDMLVVPKVKEEKQKETKNLEKIKEEKQVPYQKALKDKIMHKNIPMKEKEKLMGFFKHRSKPTKKEKIKSVYDPTPEPFHDIQLWRNDPVILRQKAGKSILIDSGDEAPKKRGRKNKNYDFAEAFLRLWQEKLKKRKDEHYADLNSEDDMVESISSEDERRNQVSIDSEKEVDLEFLEEKYARDKKFSKKRFQANESGQKLVDEKVFKKKSALKKKKQYDKWSESYEDEGEQEDSDSYSGKKLQKMKANVKKQENPIKFHPRIQTKSLSKERDSQRIEPKIHQIKEKHRKHSLDISDSLHSQNEAQLSSEDEIVIKFSSIRKKVKH